MEKLGKQLKEKRLELGMTIEDISVKTRLTQKHIKALEEGNLEFFHDDLSYLRFFVKSYCDAVGIDFEDVKEELRGSIDDYTQTISMAAQINHEEIEKNIANSEKLTRVKSAQPTEKKVRKHSKPHVDKRNLKKIDFSLVSLIAVVGVVVIVLVCALVIFMKTSNNDTDKKQNNAPIADVQKGNGENEYPTSDEKKENEKKETKELSVTKMDVKQYTIDNVEGEQEITFEVYFGGSSSGFSISVDGAVDEASARVYEYQTTATPKIKVKKGSKIQMYVGWMNATTLKINGKNVKIDDSIVNSNASQTLEFVVAGDE